MAVLLLGFVLGALLGYWYASRPAPAPPPTRAPAPRDREVTVDLEGKNLTYDTPLYVSVDRKDRVVWSSKDDKKLKHFTVTIDYLGPADAKNPPPQAHPENPFGEEKRKTWETDTGRIELGPALSAARGHMYKFTIGAKGYKPADPHIIFEGGG